jgi:hypothetical protein
MSISAIKFYIIITFGQNGKTNNNTLVPAQWLRPYIEPGDGRIRLKHVVIISGIVSVEKRQK